MSLICFDITYKKRTDNEALKLLSDSEFHQLKLMICGKYRIYDIANCFIYSKNELVDFADKTKLKDIFKARRVKITLNTEKQSQTKSNLNFKYYCKCKSGAKMICDKCDEFICESCSKKAKHSSHTNKLIKIEEYSSYLKTCLTEYAQELDDKIINDEAYQFFSYWNYDLTNEINTINQCYDFAKQELEDIKQIQIDSLIAMSDIQPFATFPSGLESLIAAYGKINTKDDYAKMISDKAKLMLESKEIMAKYTDLKQAVVNYTNSIKDIQTFNQIVLKDIKEKFIFTKRKYTPNTTGSILNTLTTSNIINTNPNNSMHNHNNSITSLGNVNFNMNLNNTYNFPHHETYNSLKKANPTTQHTQAQIPIQTQLQGVNETYQGNQTLIHEKILLKLKDQRKVLAFLTHSQTFKEKAFIDHSNFRANMTCEADMTQLNHANKLYMLTGKKYNKFYYYDYITNEVYFINNTIYSHYYGSLIYSPSNNSMYLLGGNNTTKCEAYQVNYALTQENNSTVSNEWKEIPELNEEREEFASLCMNKYIYVFFGFSPKKGYNLSSIERYHVENSNQFEIIYVNEQITLCSIACAKLSDKEILLLGGFDGKDYIDSSLIFNPNNVRIRESDIIIPNMTKHYQFLFHKESTFVQYDDYHVLFDMKGNAHLITKDSYEVFTEIQG